jgi:hypothetical protein
MEAEAIEDMATTRRQLVDDRRPYTSTVRKPKRTAVRIAEKRLTNDSIVQAMTAHCCGKQCLR